jgi:hypothetical protein
MTEQFVKVLVKMLTHPKALPLSNEALGVWLRGTLYAKAQGTNGYVPWIAVRAFAGIEPDDPETEELVAAGLWEITVGGWTIHDWGDHQIDSSYYAELGRHSAAKRQDTDYAALAQKRWRPDANGCERPMRTGCEETKTETKTKTKTETYIVPIPGVSPPGTHSVTRADEAVRVFDAWKETTGRNERTVFTAPRKALLTRWSKDYPWETLQAAARGVKWSPHHMGQNDRGTKYDSFELVFRDAKHIEMFSQYELDPSTRPTGRMMGAVERETRRLMEAGEVDRDTLAQAFGEKG